MTESILANEAWVRMGFFLVVLVLMAALEIIVPRRRQEIPRLVRWTNNISLVVLDTLLVRLAFPILAVALAVVAEDRGWGLFNMITAPAWLALVGSMEIGRAHV